MKRSGEANDLSGGLRALELLARHAPLDLAGFAARSRLTEAAAAALVDAFVQNGYVLQIPHGPLFAPTPLALTLIARHHPAGALVARAIEPLALFGRTLAIPVTLSIRRGATMLCCVASAADAPPGCRPGETMPLLGGAVALVQVACATDAALDREADRVRRDGYALERGAAGDATLAVPIAGEGGVAGVLAVHAPAGFDGDPVAMFLAALEHHAQLLAWPHGAVPPAAERPRAGAAPDPVHDAMLH